MLADSDQIRRDEEFARRLQFEDQDNDQVPLREQPAHQRFGLHEPLLDIQNNNHQIRQNMAGNLNGWGMMTKRVLCFTLAGYTIEAIVSSVVLGVGWGKDCDKPLNLWLLIALIRLFCLVPLDIQKYLVHRRGNRGVEELQLQRLTSWAQMLEFLWFIVGQTWVYASNTCSDTAPELYYTSLVYIILMYVRVALPLVLLLTLCLCWPCFMILLRRMPQINPNGADQTVISQLPTRVFHQRANESTAGDVEAQDSSDSNSDPACSICMSDYVNEDVLRCLPCNHEFHSACVDPWLGLHSTCPLCRGHINAPRQAA